MAVADPTLDSLPWGTGGADDTWQNIGLTDPLLTGAKAKQSANSVGVTDPSVNGASPTGLTPDAGGSATVTPAAPAAAPAASTPDAGLTSGDAGTRIDALYKQAGITDSGRGSGFADRAYWLEHPSEVLNGRLASDLAGTGSDQPTGTPGRGAWLNSGRNAPEASIGQPTRDANGGFWDPANAVVGTPTPGGNPNVNNPAASFTAGASAPSTGALPGWHWDSTQARFVPDTTPTDPRAALLAALQPQPGGGGGGQTPVDQTGGPLP